MRSSYILFGTSQPVTHAYVPATITAARANFVPISGKPKDNDLLRLSECLMPILLGIPYNTVDVNHNLWGILSSGAN